MSDKTGRQAFPRTYSETDMHSRTTKGGHNGMTLRQYYAGQAMQALIGIDNVSFHDVVGGAFEFADAMIKECERTTEGGTTDD